ncbi:MAG: BatA domain-containing protein [Pseudomonadota bacterium]
MKFAWPVAFLGLATLLIPIVIHLLQRGHGKRVPLGSVRWLKEDQKPKWRKLRPSQIPLLIARVLFLVAAVTILAQPFLPSEWFGSSDNIVLVHPSVAKDSPLLQDESNKQKRWLSPGFPEINTPAPLAETSSVWGLLQEADATIPTDANIQVIAPTNLDLFAKQRPLLRRTISWTASEALDIAGKNPVPMEINVIFDDQTRTQAVAVGNAITAWSTVGIVAQAKLSRVENIGKTTQWTVWLSEASIPPSQQGIVVANQGFQDAMTFDNQTKVFPQNGARIVAWPKELQSLGTSAEIPNFPEALLDVFRTHSPTIPTNTAVSESLVIPITSSELAFSTTQSGQLPAWLLQLLVAAFLIERLLSVFYGRRM